MVWTGKTFAVSAILTANDMNNLQGDITAQANGDSGAPNNQEASMAASSVNQAALKTTTSEVSTNTSGGIYLTLSGTEYGFFMMIRTTSAVTGKDTVHWSRIFDSTSYSTSYVNRILLNRTASGGTCYGRIRYVQASPPYNMGDGDVAVFIYALIDNATGKIESMWEADDPPWAYGGPTCIIPTRMDGVTGKKFRKVNAYCHNNPNWKAKLGGTVLERDIVIQSVAGAKEIEIEIDHAYKNRDMNIMPHPFMGNSLVGKTLVMLDPVSDLDVQLSELKKQGQSILELFNEGYIKFDSNLTPLSRAKPNGVIAVGGSWK